MDLHQLAYGIKIGRLLQQASDLIRQDTYLRQNTDRFLELARRLDPEVNADQYCLVVAYVLSDRFRETSIYTRFTELDPTLYDADTLVRTFVDEIGVETKVPLN